MAVFKARALRSLLQGISVLDVPRLEINSMEEAERFLKSYGIDVSDPPQWQSVQALYRKAVYFVFDFLLDRVEINIDIPREIKDVHDLGRLLMQASRAPEVAEARRKSLWACGILRVCHALFHAKYNWLNRYLALAEEQVIRPISEYVTTDGAGKKWLGPAGERGSISLVDFTYRLDKPFESLLIKLIHKPQVIAQDIYDRVALRFVTHRRLDALRVFQFLLEKNAINMAHLVPKRSRNTLFDVESAFHLLDEWDGQSVEQLNLLEQRLTSPVMPQTDNPVTSEQYRACHVTLRHLVSLPDDRQGRYHFFLPFEIQVMDRVSFEDSIMGYSSHDRYKQTQKILVLKRLLDEEILQSLPISQT